MILQVGVKILLKNSRGRYLLARRNPKKYPDIKEQWDIIGGRIEPGTPLIDNLKREIMEEVGMKYQGEPKLVAVQDIFVHRFAGSADNADAKKEIDRQVVRITYTGEIDGEPKIDSDHLEAKWLEAEEILKMESLDSYFKELLNKKIVIL